MKPVPAIFFTLLIFLNAAPLASAATNTVTSTADSGAGTLRSALASTANGDTINFSVTGTILLTSGELLVTKNLSIHGPGPVNLAVDGNAVSRVFHINPNAVVTISGLTITNGYRLFGPTNYGGGIYNDHGTLTVSNCTLSGNRAYRGGGIFNGSFSNGVAILWLVSCRFTHNTTTDNGAGVHNDGRYGSTQLTALNCIFAGNSSGNSGGGVSSGAAYGSATVAVTNCTFNANHAPQAGGGIYSDGSYGNAALTVVSSTVSSNSVNYYGGGIANWNFNGRATLTLLNSTVSGNTAGGNSGGGIANQIGTLIVRNCSLVDNSASVGGNIWNSGGSIRIGSSIMRGKAIGRNISSTGGGALSDGFNLSSDNGGGFLTGIGDQINTDPMLGPLQDNGGPTFTHALLPGSPAMDTGKNFSTSATDQRGRPRPFDLSYLANAVGGDGSDIGAFELIPPVLNIAPSSINVVISWPTNDTGYQLESTPALFPAMWTPVPGMPAIAGNRFTVTNGPATGIRFYRLKNL